MLPAPLNSRAAGLENKPLAIHLIPGPPGGGLALGPGLPAKVAPLRFAPGVRAMPAPLRLAEACLHIASPPGCPILNARQAPLAQLHV